MTEIFGQPGIRSDQFSTAQLDRLHQLVGDELARGDADHPHPVVTVRHREPEIGLADRRGDDDGTARLVVVLRSGGVSRYLPSRAARTPSLTTIRIGKVARSSTATIEAMRPGLIEP